MQKEQTGLGQENIGPIISGHPKDKPIPVLSSMQDLPVLPEDLYGIPVFPDSATLPVKDRKPRGQLSTSEQESLIAEIAQQVEAYKKGDKTLLLTTRQLAEQHQVSIGLIKKMLVKKAKEDPAVEAMKRDRSHFLKSEAGKIAGKKAAKGGLGMFTKDSTGQTPADLGRVIGGRSIFERKLGVHGRTREQIIADGSKGGIISYELGLGVHGKTREKKAEYGRRGGPASYALKVGIHGRSREEMIRHGKQAVAKDSGIFGIDSLTGKPRQQTIDQIGRIKSGVRTYIFHKGIHQRVYAADIVFEPQSANDNPPPRQLTEEQKIRFTRRGILLGMTRSEVAELIDVPLNKVPKYAKAAGVTLPSRSEIGKAYWARHRARLLAKTQSRSARRMRSQSIKEVWEGRSDEERVIIHRPSEEARRQITERAKQQVFGDRNPIEMIQTLVNSGLTQGEIAAQLSPISMSWVRNFMRENNIVTTQRERGRFKSTIDPEIKRQVQELTKERLAPLTVREQEAIDIRYGQDKSFAETGITMGISRTRVKELEVNALQKLGIKQRASETEPVEQPTKPESISVFSVPDLIARREQDKSIAHHVFSRRIHIPAIVAKLASKIPHRHK